MAVAVTALVCAATAGAASLITSADVKNDSLKSEDIKNGTLQSEDVKDGSLRADDLKDGSIGKNKLTTSVLNAIPVRITGALPTNGFSGTTAVENTSDGVSFGPYDNGGTEGGSLCSDVLNGQPLSDVEHLAFEARYTADGDTGGVGVPYLRIFLENDTHDAIFSPNTQPPDPDSQEGPFHTWVATAGLWRYDDDAGDGSGPYGLNGAPFDTVKGDHGTEEISSICISTGFTAGTDLSALLRTWEVNATDYAFGL
jgi:hypothetical protein